MPGNAVILIAGPTASGKSRAALALAAEIGGEIVNADALQVYNDLKVLSARPTAAEESIARHHLYGHIDGAVRYSVGKWSQDADHAFKGIHARGGPAIVVGGTGLYFRALEGGLAETPDIPAKIRAAAQARFNALGPDRFRDEVLAFDPAMARFRPADRQRHLRAWEVFHAAGVPLSAIQAGPAAPMRWRISARVVIEPPLRAALYNAIEARYDRMIGAGGLEEARSLAARALDPDLPVMKAVGAVELLAHLRGELALDEAIALAKRNSRRFAKRQMTWFRHQAAGWARAASAEEAVRLAIGLAVATP